MLQSCIPRAVQRSLQQSWITHLLSSPQNLTRVFSSLANSKFINKPSSISHNRIATVLRSTKVLNNSILSSRTIHTRPAALNRNASPAGFASTESATSNTITSNTLNNNTSINKNKNTDNVKKPVNSLVEDLDTTFAKTQIFNKFYTDEEDESKKVLLKIAIGKKAASQLNKLMKDDNNINLALKITVESGGCHGFQYNLKLVDLYKDQIIKQDLNSSESSWQDLSKDDLVDEEVSIFVRDNAKVVLDLSSLQILRESKVDYVKELIGTSFKVIDSPYTKSACGCGSSFDVDFSKLA